MPYDPDRQQRAGGVTNLLIIAAIAVFALYKCTGLSKSTENRQIDCMVENMKGQGEHMKRAVWEKCKRKTGYKG